MEKIGIVTLYGNDNYGNKLQNYALQEILASFDFYVETIVIQKCDKVKKSKLNRLRSQSLKSIFNSIMIRIVNRNQYISMRNRIDNFKHFSSQYLNEVNQYVPKDMSLDVECEFSLNYNYFIVGSDQVWNPNFIDDENIYFLRFANESKRISYAASFGVSELPEKYLELYKNLLIGMKRISVREDAGATIIKDLTGLEASVNVDPTLLLPREKWSNIAVRAKNKPKSRYLLTYFLGGVSNNNVKEIQDLARINNLSIINLGDKLETVTYRTGPCEFIDYISDCSIFCTDSFHGVVFSILFEKPFIVYPREGSISMYSRIDTLLDKFQLNNRKAENIRFDKEIFNIDYTNTARILELERNKALCYLAEALNVRDLE